jgi:two-component system chemotaxis sensor kinase CheA
MDKNKLTQRLMATFLEELHEHVNNMNRDLLALEKEPTGEKRAELLKVLFRSAHSLKGASRAVNVEIIETACHKLEDILGAVREGQQEFTPAIASLLLQTADAIEEFGTRLRSEQELTDTPLQKLIPQLNAIVAAEGADVGASASHTGASTDIKPAAPVAPVQPASAPVVEIERSNSPASSPTPAAAEVRSMSASATIRVPAEKLDSLLAQSGELLVARRRVEFRAHDAETLCETATLLRNEWRELERPLRTVCQTDGTSAGTQNNSVLPRRATALLERTSQHINQLSKRLDQLVANMHVDSRLLGQTCDALDSDVYRVRMLPFAEACGGLERAVRDLAQATGKQVKLIVLGDDVEVDRSVLEGLKDPLLHLVRNAIDHGIESAEQRQTSGKPPIASVTVSAALRGGQVEVVVADDGQGFDLEKIRAKAFRQGEPVPESDRDALQLVFAPGFSTAPIVTDVSGRGVGLDVVQSQIEMLHGSVDVSFIKGQGTQFSLTVPLTLTTIRSLLASTAGQTFAIPTANVEQIVRFDSEKVRTISGRDMLLLGESPIPIVLLSATLGLETDQQLAAGKILAIVLMSGEQRAAFVVNEVIAEQEVLVKSLGARIRRVRHVSGGTILPSGDVALVLNVPNVLRSSLGQQLKYSLSSDRPSAAATGKKRVLAVDDSMTTRTLMKSILVAAGYDVTVAVDGQHAWELVQSAPFDVVVSDVDMPRMTGFDLTSAIRGSAVAENLPVILVTARGSDEDKKKGIQAGANAYIIKSSFDQGSLLDAIGQML